MQNKAYGTEITLKELIALRYEVIPKALKGAAKWLQLPGEKLTQTRGRGIEFDATREYQAGDDIRSMAWRVTARSLKPHIKIYREEKERPVWLAIDLSPSLYFGTRCMFKSVRGIQQAAQLGWAALGNQERVGALIATTDKTQVYPPKAYEKNFLAILNSLAEASRIQPPFNEKNYLKNLLLALQQNFRSDNLIYVVSDFFEFDEEVKKLILAIAQRAQLVLIFIYDIFEAEAPPPSQYIVTNGQQRISFYMDNLENRSAYQQQFHAKKNDLTVFARKNKIHLHILSTQQQHTEVMKA